MKLKLVFIVFFFFVGGSTQALAQGGPPLITDDPGTPGDGHWEINIASQGESTNTSSSFQVPYFDINYGWGDRIQLKFETGGIVYSGVQNNLEGGWGGGLAGVKWRFVGNQDGDLLISTYPQVAFGYFLTSANPTLVQMNNSFIFPFEFAKSFDAFTINPEVGYIFYSQGPNQFMYGLVFAYQTSKTLELLSEVHDSTYVDGSGTQFLFNLGAHYDLNDNLSLIGSVGHTLQNYPNEAAELLSYLGIQIRI